MHMADDTIELNRRRVLGGIITVGAAAAAAGAGTFAAFSDTETSSENTISAGKLNLAFGDGSDGSATTTISVSDAKPDASGSGTSTLENTGNIDGYVDLVFGSPSNTEGDNPESEGDTDSPGDLGNILEVDVIVGTTTVRSGTFNDVFDGTEADVSIPLAANSTKDITISWSLPGSAGNNIQGDTCSADLTVELGQTTGQ